MTMCGKAVHYDWVRQIVSQGVARTGRFLGLVLSVLAMACASSGTIQRKELVAPPEHGHTLRFELSESERSAQHLWQRPLGGLITDLDLSDNGNTILVATLPDSDRIQDAHSEGSSRVALLDLSGNELWSRALPAPVRAQALAEDSSLSVVTDANSVIRAFNGKGKEVWKAEGACRPDVQLRARRVVCFYGESTGKSRKIFEVFDWDGRKRLSYGDGSEESLDLSLARDGEGAVLALARGQLVYFDRDFRKVWERSMDGEIIDVAVASGDERWVAVLTASSRSGQKIVVLDPRGEPVASSGGIALRNLEQVEGSGALKDGQVIAYGNGPGGQTLTYFALAAGRLERRWRVADSRFADYSSRMILDGKSIAIGFEDMVSGGRHSHILAFGFAGKLRWNIPLLTEEGAYLFDYAAPGGEDDLNAIAVTGTDAGVLSAFRIGPKPAGKDTD